MKNISTALFLSTLAALSLGVAQTAHAQTTVRFSTVEFRDTTLNDALEIIFQAANNPAHTIDPSASLVPISTMTLQNIQWDNALRTLANQNNFKVSRGADGSYLVEPREPVLENGGENGGVMSGAIPGGFGNNPRGNTPANPFGGAGFGGGGFGGARPAPAARPNVNFELLPSVSRRSNAQTNPRGIGGGGAGGATTSTADQQIIPITVRHIYVGGIAQLFTNSSTIATEGFVSPGQISSGGFGGNNGGGGGFGGNNGGGFGGGGFGGSSGGFGGGGFGGSSGGFGGSSGGFGGGSFGGSSGGFGGGSSGGFGGGSFGF